MIIYAAYEDGPEAGWYASFHMKEEDAQLAVNDLIKEFEFETKEIEKHIRESDRKTFKGTDEEFEEYVQSYLEMRKELYSYRVVKVYVNE